MERAAQPLQKQSAPRKQMLLLQQAWNYWLLSVSFSQVRAGRKWPWSSCRGCPRGWDMLPLQSKPLVQLHAQTGRAATVLDQLFLCTLHPSHSWSTCRLSCLAAEVPVQRAEESERGVHLQHLQKDAGLHSGAGSSNVREPAELLLLRPCETKAPQRCSSIYSLAKARKKGSGSPWKPHLCSYTLVMSYLLWSVFSFPHNCYKFSWWCSNKALLFWGFTMGQYWIFMVRNISEEAAGKGSPTDISMIWKHTFSLRSKRFSALYYLPEYSISCHMKTIFTLSFPSQLKLKVSVNAVRAAGRCCIKHRRKIPMSLDFTPLGRGVSYFRMLDTSTNKIYLSIPFCSLDKEEKYVTESWE